MLKLIIPGKELFDEETQRFEYTDPFELEMEHSLVSLSKWESFYEKPFLSDQPKTREETIYYLECMCLTEGFDVSQLSTLSAEELDQVNKYISKKQTATWFSESSEPGRAKSSQVITSEVIYYWMISLNVPMECQYWHLNRLLTLIRVINAKNQPAKKMSKAEAAARSRELNKMRKAQLGTQG